MKALASLLLVLCASCASIPAAVNVKAEGDVELWTDANSGVAVGEGSVAGAVYSKGALDLNLTQYDLERGIVYIWNRELDVSEQRDLGDPLPAWCTAILPASAVMRWGFEFEPEL